MAQHARGVARGRAREHPAEGHDLRDRLAAVLVGDVLDHAVAALHREVDVDIRHRDALGVQEPLEQQVVLERVHVGDPQRVGDDRAGGRATPGAHRDPVVLRELDEVPDDQEVGREAHLLDHAQLHLEPLDRGRRRRVAVALAQPLVGAPAEVALLVLALRARGSAGSASCRARSRPGTARRSRASWRSTRATRRSRPPSRPSPSNRTRSCRTTASARSACSSSARRGAPCGGRSARGVR